MFTKKWVKFAQDHRKEIAAEGLNYVMHKNESHANSLLKELKYVFSLPMISVLPESDISKKIEHYTHFSCQKRAKLDVLLSHSIEQIKKSDHSDLDKFYKLSYLESERKVNKTLDIDQVPLAQENYQSFKDQQIDMIKQELSPEFFKQQAEHERNTVKAFMKEGEHAGVIIHSGAGLLAKICEHISAANELELKEKIEEFQSQRDLKIQ